MKSKSDFQNENDYYEYFRDYTASKILSSMMGMADNECVAFSYFSTKELIEESIEKSNALIKKLKAI